MRRQVFLGDLQKGRVFWSLDGRKFKVSRNLSPAGVSVKLLEEREVTIEDRTFKAKVKSGTEVWSCTAPVQVEVRA